MTLNPRTQPSAPHNWGTNFPTQITPPQLQTPFQPSVNRIIASFLQIFIGFYGTGYWYLGNKKKALPQLIIGALLTISLIIINFTYINHFLFCFDHQQSGTGTQIYSQFNNYRIWFWLSEFIFLFFWLSFISYIWWDAYKNIFKTPIFKTTFFKASQLSAGETE